MNKKDILIAAGCFWGTEAYYKKIKGTISTEVGYANGDSDNPTYEEVCNSSGHVEVLKLEFDLDIISLQELFNSYIRIIDPFSKNKQGNDIGVQYRAGLYTNDLSILDDLSKIIKEWESVNGKTVIELKEINNYFKAELNHQNYLTNNPQGYCHINLLNIPDELK